MHVTIGAGSYIEVTIPWVIQSDGFAAVIAGQLLHMEATTSLQYRSLAECESLEYKIKSVFDVSIVLDFVLQYCTLIPEYITQKGGMIIKTGV